MASKFKCFTCTRKDIVKEAAKYCVECRDCYCVQCLNLHKKLPSMRGHKLLDRCLIHRARLEDMWCKKHNEIACATCIGLKHGACGDIHCITKEVDKLFEKSADVHIKRQLARTITAMKDIKKAKVNLVDEIEKSKKNATDCITKLRKEMESELEKPDKEYVEELEAEDDKIATRLHDDINEADAHINELKQSSNKLKNAGGNKVQEFLCLKAAEINIVKTNEKIELLQSHLDMEMTSLPDSGTKRYTQQQLQRFENVPQPNPRVTMQKDVGVKLANDVLTCYIYGSCFTEDGTLLLTDFSNKKLKRVNLSTGLIPDHLVLKDAPFAVCVTSKDEAAVSLCYIHTIQFVSVGNKMGTTRQLKLDHTCWGLAYNDGRLFTSDCGRSLYIYDLNGILLRKITTDKSENSIFDVNRHISLSSNGYKLYVIDQHKGVITLDLQGNYESTYTDPDLLLPQGVCTDSRGNIFVCGGLQSNIVQINEKSKRKTGVIGKVINSISASFNPQQNKLIITLQNSNTVKIYELEY